MPDGYRTSDGKVFMENKGVVTDYGAKYDAEAHQAELDGKAGGGSGQTWHYADEVEKIYDAGYNYFTSGRNDEAIAKFNEYIAHQEHSRFNNSSYRYRAACYLNKGNNDQAIADATSAINIDDVDPLAHLVRGIAYKNKGNREQAIVDLKKAADYGTGSLAQHGNKALQILSGMGIQYTRQNLYRASSSSSRSTSSSGGGSILFNIIGAIVVAIIGFNILGWLGLIGGAVAGFFLGKWLSGKLIGKILLIALLVVIGGGFIISKLPSTPAADNTQTETEEVRE